MKRREDVDAHRLRLAAVTAADAVALAVFRPRPHLTLHLIAHPSAAADQLGADRAVAVVATTGLWCAAAWMALGLLTALGGRLPGLGGRACAAFTAVTLPPSIRRSVVAALGAGAIGGVLGVGLLGGSASASPASLHAAVSGSSVASSPAVHRAVGGHPGPGPSWPTSTPSPPHHHGPDGATDRVTVRVQAGDSLWLIAARRLGDHATPDRVSAYWPQVYAANRSVIGTDPGLVQPGQVLHLPTPRPS